MVKSCNILFWEIYIYRRITIFDVFIKNIKSKLKDIYFKITPQRKIYTYGASFHFNYENPTLREKIDKFLCDKIFDVPKKYSKYKISNFDILRIYGVKEFFDYSIGRYVDRGSRLYKASLSDRGRVLMSEEEAEQEAKKNKTRIMKETQEKEDGEYIGQLESYFKRKNINPGEVLTAIERSGGYYDKRN